MEGISGREKSSQESGMFEWDIDPTNYIKDSTEDLYKATVVTHLLIPPPGP